MVCNRRRSLQRQFLTESGHAPSSDKCEHAVQFVKSSDDIKSLFRIKSNATGGEYVARFMYAMT